MLNVPGHTTIDWMITNCQMSQSETIISSINNLIALGYIVTYNSDCVWMWIYGFHTNCCGNRILLETMFYCHRSELHPKEWWSTLNRFWWLRNLRVLFFAWPKKHIHPLPFVFRQIKSFQNTRSTEWRVCTTNWYQIHMCLRLCVSLSPPMVIFIALLVSNVNFWRYYHITSSLLAVRFLKTTKQKYSKEEN